MNKCEREHNQNEKDLRQKKKSRMNEFSDKDVELMEFVYTLRIKLQCIMMEYYKQPKNDFKELGQHPLIFYFSNAYRNQDFNAYQIVEPILEYKKKYNKDFILNNLKDKRNPILQLFIGNLNQAIITMIDRTYINNKRVYDLVRGSEGESVEDKIKIVVENSDVVKQREMDVRNALSCIDNIYYFTEFNGNNIADGIEFLLCVNTYHNIDETDPNDTMLQVSDEMSETISMCERSRLQKLVLVNIYRKDFLLFIHLLKPKYIQYIGHTEIDFLRFRSRQRVCEWDISNEYGSIHADFIFLNSCSSSEMASKLSRYCALRTLGYKFKLYNSIATKITENLYKNQTIHEVLDTFDVKLSAAINTTEPYIRELYKSSPIQDLKNAYLLVKHYKTYKDNLH